MEPSPRFIIRVPGSTSNLGPGFDTLGLALTLYNDFTIEPLAEAPDQLTGEAGGVALRAQDCPFFPMFEAVCRLADAPAPALAVTLQGNVPLGVGLGWSAVARVAGAMAANHLLAYPFTKEALLTALAAAEGHPDNVTPSLYGGLTATVQTKKGLIVHVYQPAALWRVVLFVPDYTVATDKARKALPKQVRLSDAVFNLSRMPFVIDALVAGDAAELGRVLEDRLHEPYRAENVKRHGKLTRAAKEAGAAATFISGAGPALAAFCLGDELAERVRQAMLAAAEGAKFHAEAMVLEPESQGARLAEE